MASDTRDTTPTATSSSSVIKERRCRIEWLYPVSVRSVSSGTRTCPLVERPARSSVTRVSWTPSNFMTEKISLKKKEKTIRYLKYKYLKCFKLFWILIAVQPLTFIYIHFSLLRFIVKIKIHVNVIFYIILSNMKQTPNFIGGLPKKGLMSIKNFFL